MSAPAIVAIVGATATGKTEVGEAVAERLGGEIVCADSRQVYAELEIGTGKPGRPARVERPHHLFDALSLGMPASAGWYARAAAAACAAIFARGATPILVGGSGLYLRALQTGLSGQPPQAPEIRARLLDEAETLGHDALHRRLAEHDPETAARVAPRDVQRVTRALEVLEASGKPLSWWHRAPVQSPLDAVWHVFEIQVEAEELGRRIAARTRAMFAGGLVDEVRTTLGAGKEGELRALAAVGYDEALDLISGASTLAEAEERTNRRTRQLAKRQRTWFRHQIQAERVDGAVRAPRAASDAILARLDLGSH